jgi:hypothetical protein
MEGANLLLSSFLKNTEKSLNGTNFQKNIDVHHAVAQEGEPLKGASSVGYMRRCCTSTLARIKNSTDHVVEEQGRRLMNAGS